MYMDANATTPLLPEVVEAMGPYWLEVFGNASSIHQAGQSARAAVDRARESLARLIGCQASEIVFTSGGTESDNMALFGVLQPLLDAGETPHLITSSIEHNAILNTAEALRKRGVEVTLVSPTPAGLIEPEALKAAMRPNTRLVSIMLGNNETGVVQPVAELAAIAHAGGALFHTDAIQAVGKIPIDLARLHDVDLLSLSGHKMYAPKGTGALFLRKKTQLAPMLFGGMHERGRRPGTENVPGIVGLGRAAELAAEWLSNGGPERLAALRDRLEQGVLAGTGAASGVNGAGAPRAANTTNLYFEGVEAEALVIALDLKGMAISGGSACQSGATKPSHVLLAMGMPEARAWGSVRISLSRLNTEEEIEAGIGLIVEAVGRLRRVAAVA
jgi:cysteine desulfurase